MKIYNSTQTIQENNHTEWYELQVLSIWDYKKQPVCFKYVGGNLLAFCLYKYCKTQPNERVLITELSSDIKDELISMGYSLK